MENLETKNLLNLEETIAKELLENTKYPWEVLDRIENFIIGLGSSLDSNLFEKRGDNIWIAKSAKIAPTACIEGPTIIDENAEIRHSAFIRGKVIVGKNSVVGNSTELKNCILFNNTQAPHFNYIGDSILGYKAHLGAGVILSNLRIDKANIYIKYNKQFLNTDLRKFGAIVGDETEIGCNSVLNPGTILGRNVLVTPLCSIVGVVDEKKTVKRDGGF